MEKPTNELRYVRSLTATNFGCLKHVQIDLGRFHAIIGPNDSGKSTILRAIRTGVQLSGGCFTGGLPGLAPTAVCRPFDPGTHKEAVVEIGFSDGADFRAVLREDTVEESVRAPGGDEFPSPHARKLWDPPSLIAGLDGPSQVLRGTAAPRLMRLDFDALRAPSRLIPSSRPIDISDERGDGIAGVFDALMIRTIDGFLEIRESVKRFFPTVKSIGIRNVEQPGDSSAVLKVLEIELHDGTRVPADFVSQGMLYYMAFSALRFLAPAFVLLVEEPENGFHPARIKDVMAVLRAVSQTTQVILTTHSPLVINEMLPDEVSVVWRDAACTTRAMPIAKTPNFEERSKVYALGELWLSYADGRDERTLRELPDPS